MLTNNDLKEIGHLVNNLLNLRFEEFAVMMQNEFKYIHAILDTKADKSDITEIRSDITEMKGDITEIRSDITEIRSDITEIRLEIGEMKSDASLLRADVAEIRSDLNDTRLDVADIKYEMKKITEHVGKHDNCIYTLENDMKLVKTKLNFN